ncbi:hypothetical protein CCHR01_15212 [Colletotrichum chrysophilum]|uniref:Uncharacterized protein n=1 Tax=Colletotrichum chrysophilum TaxID=1836956 RepID=A0AAD9EBK9_9PEZI|nr:hypothetical protein CCHR01_15212 [Colletotrichum chrysophilum]
MTAPVAHGTAWSNLDRPSTVLTVHGIRKETKMLTCDGAAGSGMPGMKFHCSKAVCTITRIEAGPLRDPDGIIDPIAAVRQTAVAGSVRQWNHGTGSPDQAASPQRQCQRRHPDSDAANKTRAAETCSSTVAIVMRWPRLKQAHPGPTAGSLLQKDSQGRPPKRARRRAGSNSQTGAGHFTHALRHAPHPWPLQLGAVRLVTWHSDPMERVSGGSVPTEPGSVERENGNPVALPGFLR